jgi:CRP/FNR family transcriptional regulator
LSSATRARAPKPRGGGSRAVCDACAVRGLAVCGALTNEQLPRLAEIAIDRRLEAGQTLFQEGDPAEDVFTLTAGMLKLYKLMSDGRRQITGFLMPGDFLGLAFGRTYVYSAEAVTPVTLCRFRRVQFLLLLDQCPAMEKSLLGRASTELAANQEQMLLLGRKTARERLASFLLRLARRRNPDAGNVIELPMSRSDIADFIGLTIETVSRTLTLFRKEGVIRLPDTHRAVVVSWPRLEQMAGS